MQEQCTSNFKIYKLKNITHLCSTGSNRKNIEFRLTEVKASMRFWWRALNYYDNAHDMWQDEKKIFGDGDNIKSPIEFRLLQGNWKFKEDQDSHVVSEYYDNKMDKNGEKIKKQRTITCTSSGKEIAFKMSLYKRKISEKEFTDKSIYFYDSLLKLSFILGGIGKRSRRGCGVLKVETEDKHNNCNVTYEEIYELIKVCMDELNIIKFYDFDLEIDDDYIKIIRKKEYIESSCKYPYIEEILISKNNINENDFYGDDGRIKKAIDTTKKKKLYYKKIKNIKFACPVYVTCYGEENILYPIIIKLHNTQINSENISKIYEKYYIEFKEAIL